MYELIKYFPLQLNKALEIGEKIELTKTNRKISNIVVTGLGASGIGGNMISELLYENLKVPVLVNRSYFLPNYVNEETLLILSSYSGNTEETLSVAKQAAERNIHAVCVTSGGKLAEFAYQHNYDLIKIPAGFPPRTCLGYSVIQLLYILHGYGMIDDSFKTRIQETAFLLEREQNRIVEDAEFLAGKLQDKVMVLYAEDKYESTVLRLKQQINENSKMHCWYNIIPEMNHNELVGWRKPNNNLAVLLLRSDDEFHRNTQRILFKKDVIFKLGDDVYEVDAKGANTFEKHFYLIHFGDWLSYHLALLQGFDPMEIEVLNNLKAHMATI